MKHNKSWEDQLSAIYTEMTGIKVDFKYQKDHKKQIEAGKRAEKKYLEKHGNNMMLGLDRKQSTNENRAGYIARNNICGITIAVLPIDFKIDPKRLDAPCEMCINAQCPYSMGRR